MIMFQLDYTRHLLELGAADAAARMDEIEALLLGTRHTTGSPEATRRRKPLPGS